MRKMRQRVNAKTGEEQCSFVEGKRTQNAVYALRTLIEGAIEQQKDTCLCFIDHTKSFDKIKHEKVIKILEDIHIDGKDLRIIQNIYWNKKISHQYKQQNRPGWATASHPTGMH